jgi:hypothetical protein
MGDERFAAEISQTKGRLKSRPSFMEQCSGV